MSHAGALEVPPVKQLVAILLLGVYAINLGYAFEGSLTPVRDFVFVSRTLAGTDSKPDGGRGGNRFRDSWIGRLPVPLPYNYVRGIDLQKVDFEEGKPSYLNGRWSDRGWWYYYLYAATLKVPLGTWLLGLLVAGMKLWPAVRRRSAAGSSAGVREPADGTRPRRSATWRDEVVLLAPAVVLFVLVSSQTGFSRYFRYVLPCFPFVYVWLGQAGRWWSDADRGITEADEPPDSDMGRGLKGCPETDPRIPPVGDRPSPQPSPRRGAGVAGEPLRERFRRWPAWLVGAALGWSIVSSLSVFPYSMSYFNELAGGPRHGHLHLVDANIDWGQDMFHLRDWIRKHPEAAPLHVAPLCFVAPRHYGIESRTPPGEPLPGWYAMSIHRIHGESGQYGFFLHYQPVARVGYSIYIYHVTFDEANRVRRILGQPELAPEETMPLSRADRVHGSPDSGPDSPACCGDDRPVESAARESGPGRRS